MLQPHCCMIFLCMRIQVLSPLLPSAGSGRILCSPGLLRIALLRSSQSASSWRAPVHIAVGGPPGSGIARSCVSVSLATTDSAKQLPKVLLPLCLPSVTVRSSCLPHILISPSERSFTDNWRRGESLAHEIRPPPPPAGSREASPTLRPDVSRCS